MYNIDSKGRIVDSLTGRVVHSSHITNYAKSLGIPPAYRKVVVYPKGSGSKVLACGVDSKGRKQCIYDPAVVKRNQEKRFAKVRRLDKVFCGLEEHVQGVVRRAATSNAAVVEYESLMCLIIHIILTCNFRIGSERHLRDNGTHGVTTLQWRHVTASNDKVTFDFTGKRGVRNEAQCADVAMGAFLRRLRKVSPVAGPASRVFRYYCGEEWHDITSKHVNKWLLRFNKHITAKDLRTWQANRLFIKYCTKERLGASEAIKRVAAHLHHTPAVCKKNYIDPRNLARFPPGQR